MDDKTFKMVSGVTTGLESIGVSLVAFFAPPMAPAICAAVPIVGTAAQIAGAIGGAKNATNETPIDSKPVVTPDTILKVLSSI